MISGPDFIRCKCRLTFFPLLVLVLYYISAASDIRHQGVSVGRSCRWRLEERDMEITTSEGKTVVVKVTVEQIRIWSINACTEIH